jgi:hypothetical protein
MKGLLKKTSPQGVQYNSFPGKMSKLYVAFSREVS